MNDTVAANVPSWYAYLKPATRQALAYARWRCTAGLRFRDHLRRDHRITAVEPVRRREWHQGNWYFRCSCEGGVRGFLKTAGLPGVVDREVEILTRLRSGDSAWQDHAPALLAHGVVGGLPFLVLEFVEARSVEEILRSGESLDDDTTRCVLEQMIVLVDALHAAGIVHRDVRPGNLLLGTAPDGDPCLRLIDFALAVDAGPGGLGELPHLLDLPRVRAGIGRGLCPAPLVWDDAYSFLRVAEMLVPDLSERHPAARSALAERIGRLRHVASGD